MRANGEEARRPLAAKLAGPAVALAVSCFCAAMWGLLIRSHVASPAPALSPPDYASLLRPGEQERAARWGIYLGNARIGTSDMRVTRRSDGNIMLTTKADAQLGPAARFIAGVAGTLDVEFQAVVSPLRGLLSWGAESKLLDASLQGLVRGNEMLVKGRVAGRRVDSVLPYEPGGLISEAFSPLAGVPALDRRQVGQSWTVSILNPVTGDLQDVAVHVARVEDIDAGEASLTAFQLDFQSSSGRWKCWVTEQGEVLVQGTPFGLTLRREDVPAEVLHALSVAGAAPPAASQ